MPDRELAYMVLDEDVEIEECPVCEHQSMVVMTAHMISSRGVTDVEHPFRRCVECDPPDDDDED